MSAREMKPAAFVDKLSGILGVPNGSNIVDLMRALPDPPVGRAVLPLYTAEQLATVEREALERAAKPPISCDYCGDGKRTGLPGTACENCLGTGLKYPEASK